MKAVDARFSESAAAFRRFFLELREAFLERDGVFTQIELALLCREHVLIIGPPGTAKSAIAGATLGRILDETNGKPSLFSKQLAENTVQTDLIGPVNFKVLTDTGRTEYLVDEGMLGAVHAFLDEVFDGRDMLLRSILNVLHERELKHGTRVTPGRCECAVMTSNRYLSEVLQRSPETLQAFADRISFISFTPKAFARKASRAQMLRAAQAGQRPALHARLTLQQLDVLQDVVSAVEVPSMVAEGLEALGDALEKELLAQVAKLPDYVPTKYFSQRSMVKALWALKAVVVRDRIYRRPDRRLVADLSDLEALRPFFLLGGPPPSELEALTRASPDPRERAQLDIIRVEHKAFDDAWARVLPVLSEAAAREAGELKLKDEAQAAEAVTKGWNPAVASTLARSLRDKLVPGPRHPDNRTPLLRHAQSLTIAFEQRLARGLSGQTDGRAGNALLGSFGDALELVRAVPELAARAGTAARAVVEFCRSAGEMLALAAEASEYDDALRLEAVAALALDLGDELARVVELLQVASLVEAQAADAARATLAPVRERMAAALRRRAARTFHGAAPKKGDALDALAADSRRLRELEEALVDLSPAQRGLRAELLGPLGEAYLKDVVGGLPFSRLDQVFRALQAAVDNLRREGAAPETALRSVRAQLDERCAAYARQLAAQAAPAAPERAAALGGEAYATYRQLSQAAPEGELSAVLGLEGLLAAAGSASLPAPVRDAVATAELTSLAARIRFLHGWQAAVVGALPPPQSLRERGTADKVFDAFVKSRFPMLVTKEGELLKLKTTAQRLAALPGESGEAARKLEGAVQRLAEDFGAFSRTLLDARGP